MSHATHFGDCSLHIGPLDVKSKLAAVNQDGLIKDWVIPKAQGPLQQLHCFC